MTDTPFQIGDSVAIKPGVIDPDDGVTDLGGWQGRVTGFDEQDPSLVEFDWDSVTLRAIPFERLLEQEVEGLAWPTMQLKSDDLLPASARDDEQDVDAARTEIEAAIRAELDATGILHALGEHGKAVVALLHQLPAIDEQATLQAWHTYLQQALALPFIAEVAGEPRGLFRPRAAPRVPRPLRRGDRLTVTAIARLDQALGTMVQAEHKRRSFEVPLADLAITTKSAANYQLLSDYAEWTFER